MDNFRNLGIRLVRVGPSPAGRESNCCFSGFTLTVCLQTASRMPSNTLLIHLSPPDQLFYLPSLSNSRLSSLPPSPNGGHNSDPEMDSNRSRTNGDVIPPFKKKSLDTNSDGEVRQDHWERHRAGHEREPRKTAGSLDLVRFAFHTL